MRCKRAVRQCAVLAPRAKGGFPRPFPSSLTPQRLVPFTCPPPGICPLCVADKKGPQPASACAAPSTCKCLCRMCLCRKCGPKLEWPQT